MRIQLALNVKDIDRAVDHYSRMFGVVPHKTRPGYANFEVADPPLKLVLFENAGADQDLNHLGVEALTQDEYDEAVSRLAAVGLSAPVEDTVCCHARQDKLWVRDQAQLSWEWYKITDDTIDATQAENDAAGCCDGADTKGNTQGKVCCA